MNGKGLILALAAGALMLACGSSDDGKSGTGGSSTGGKGGSSGGSGGSGGSTGGSGGSTGGGAGTSSGGSTGGGGATGGTGGGTTDAGACGDFGQVDQCKTCLATHCCSEGTKCAADANCSGMVTCARACPEPANTSSPCVQACAGQFSNGGQYFNPIIICMSNQCGTVCGYL